MGAIHNKHSGTQPNNTHEDIEKGKGEDEVSIVENDNGQRTADDEQLSEDVHQHDQYEPCQREESNRDVLRFGGRDREEHLS